MTASTPTASTPAWPFTWETTASEVLDGVDLTGRRAVVTGGASGIGIETSDSRSAGPTRGSSRTRCTRAASVRTCSGTSPREELRRLRASAGAPAPWKTPQQGAATSVLLAASPLVEGVSGRYFEDVAEAGIHQPGTRTGVAAYALDPEAADRLWEVSLLTLSA